VVGCRALYTNIREGSAVQPNQTTITLSLSRAAGKNRRLNWDRDLCGPALCTTSSVDVVPIELATDQRGLLQTDQPLCIAMAGTEVLGPLLCVAVAVTGR